MNAVFTSAKRHQSRIAAAVSSGPLSMRECSAWMHRAIWACRLLIFLGLVGPVGVVGLPVCPAFPLVAPVVPFGRVGQAAVGRGSCRVARRRVSSAGSQGQCWGRCRVSWLADRAIRAGVLISCVLMVRVRARA